MIRATRTLALMVNLDPKFVFLALLVLLVGIVIHLARKSSTFRGYQDVAQDAERLRGVLKGETFRDGSDLVVSGSQDKFPAMVRFSYDENTPGLNIRMSAPANFTVTISPKGSQGTGEGRMLIRTGDDMFDARFTTKTDHMAQAKMFVGSKQTVALLQKLCCSSKTFLAISNGNIELSELVIPTPYTSTHVADHLQNMSKLALKLQAMPGAETVKVRAYQREGSSMPGKIAVAAVLLMGLAIFVFEARKPDLSVTELKAQAGTIALPEGVLPVDGAKLTGLNGWRVVKSEDFDPDTAAWVRGQGLPVQGRLEGDYSGKSNLRDVIYVLTNDADTMRIAIIANDRVVYDTRYPKLAVASKFSKYNWNATQWQTPPTDPAGDGLLLVTRKDDPKSGIVLYWDGKRVTTAVPENYERVNLQ
jgi:hypothetical protein